MKYSEMDIEKMAIKDKEYEKIRDLFVTLINNPYKQKRRYYYINIFKEVKKYGSFQSFGELALLTNKRRKAKLETLTDTHFAVLSKFDYK